MVVVVRRRVLVSVTRPSKMSVVVRRRVMVFVNGRVLSGISHPDGTKMVTVVEVSLDPQDTKDIYIPELEFLQIQQLIQSCSKASVLNPCIFPNNKSPTCTSFRSSPRVLLPWRQLATLGLKLVMACGWQTATGTRLAPVSCFELS